MLLDELLKLPEYRRGRPTASVARHRHLLPICPGFLDRSGHRDLDVAHGKTCQKNEARPSTILVAIVFVATRGRSVHASRAINQSLPMNYQLIPKELRPIAEKVEAQKADF
jgi:hypothetical protein